MIEPLEPKTSPLKVLSYPNPFLDNPCEPVTEFGPELHAELDEMRVLMKQSNGIGLAANQVGLLKRMFVMEDEKGRLWDFVNPVIEERDGAQFQTEGCLSAPGIRLQVPRAETVSVKAQDREGNEFRIVAQGIEAVCIQHETDHLDGVFFTERVNRQQRRAALRELEKRGR